MHVALPAPTEEEEAAMRETVRAAAEMEERVRRLITTDTDDDREPSAPPKLTVLRPTPRVRALHSSIRASRTPRATFVRDANALVHLLIEEALALLPERAEQIETPCGSYSGCAQPAAHELCAVSIMRAADCMLHVLSQIVPGVAVGKILIRRDEATARPSLLYSKLPPNLAQYHILLLDPMLATGGSCVKALSVLVDAGAIAERIIFVNLVCVKEGLDAVRAAYPSVRIVTGEVDPLLNEQKYIVPGLGDFGDRYFGTD